MAESSTRQHWNHTAKLSAMIESAVTGKSVDVFKHHPDKSKHIEKPQIKVSIGQLREFFGFG